MASLYDLSSQVAPFVVDCPDGVQKWALRQAACRFLADSHLWRVSLSHTVSGEEVLAVGINEFSGMPVNTFVASCLSLTVDGCNYISGWAFAGDVLELEVAPRNSAVLKLDVVLGGASSLSAIPMPLLARYGGAIADLALFLIQSQVSRPYSSPDGAAQALARYGAQMHAANVERLTGGRSGDAVLTTAIPEYF